MVRFHEAWTDSREPSPPRPMPGPLSRHGAALAATLLAPALLMAVPTPAAAQGSGQPAPASDRPTLVVFITVDQMRSDYHDRFADQLSGGLARLYRGAVFTNAHQDHAITETAPGHASTMSGRFPAHTGIVRNSAGVNDDQAPLVGGGGDGASPFRFRGSTLMDWMRIADPRSRGLSISRKDRGAILPLGRAHQSVFWYASDGRFTTSAYYADTLPTWLQRYNARRLPHQYAGQQWSLLLPESAYPERDSVIQENRGKDFLFPHTVPADTTRAVASIIGFPFMDDLIANAALEGVQAMELGTGPQTDLLAVSFSTTDAIGHSFGPDSRELHDQILRLDRVLGRFMDSLLVLRDSSRVIFTLTGDHGVAPLPEVESYYPHPGATRYDSRAISAAGDSVLRAFGIPDGAVKMEDRMVRVVDPEAVRRAGVSVGLVMESYAEAVRRVHGVARVDRWRDLAAMDTTSDEVARRWLHMIPPDMTPELVVTIMPYSVSTTQTSFTHGLPYDHDSRVPVVFYGAPFAPGRYDSFTRVVDMAPTLAEVIGVSPTETLDGRVLHQALKR